VTAKYSVLKPGGSGFELKAVAQRPMDSVSQPFEDGSIERNINKRPDILNPH